MKMETAGSTESVVPAYQTTPVAYKKTAVLLLTTCLKFHILTEQSCSPNISARGSNFSLTTSFSFLIIKYFIEGLN